jgi:cysteinyl-tRNA synthetase
MSTEDTEFDTYLEGFKKRVYEAFCDNINTPGVVIEVDEAIKKTNIYLESKTKKITFLEKAYNTIIKPFNSMGLEYNANESSSSEAAVLTAITKFRDEIRVNAKSDFKTILDICDKFRDYDMVDLNVRIEDKKIGDPSTWKYENKEILVKEREKKIEDKLKKEE